MDATTAAVLFLGGAICYCLYQWCLLIGGIINGHRRAKEAHYGSTDSPADHGAGATSAVATIKNGAIPGTSIAVGNTGTYGPGTITHVPPGYAKALAMSQQNLLRGGLTLSQQAYFKTYQQLYQQYVQQSQGQQNYTVFSWGGGGAGGGGQVYDRKPVAHDGIKLGEIIGYRCWLLTTAGYLKSCAADAVWAPDEIMEGDIGKDGCGLGVHAWKSKSLMLQYGDHFGSARYAIGSIRMWGELVEHDRGYRSQYASILSIDDVMVPNASQAMLNEMLHHLRQKYRVS